MAADSKPRSRRGRDGPSQLCDLFLHAAAELGFESDREVAELAEVSVENVANWRSGSVREFKTQKLATIKANIAREIQRLKERAGAQDDPSTLGSLEVEEGSGPADLQKQFRDRVLYDYLGHRFLYFDPAGAIAWENLIRRDYGQEDWLSGVNHCAEAWLDSTRSRTGGVKGPIADCLGAGRRGTPVGLDVISLGPGEGQKEAAFLKHVLNDSARDLGLAWLSYAPVDVSIPLLLTAAKRARELFRNAGRGAYQIRAFCADFEEGGLGFLERLPTSSPTQREGVRLILILGNVFGNLRDEEGFVRRKLWKLARPGDLVWMEVGLRIDPLSKDPLYRMTESPREETAAETNRRLLLEGPYRRLEAASGRRPTELETRIWVREDDESARIPGSYNFCHDLLIKDERRVCTMLYSRRYRVEDLSTWFERLGFVVLRLEKTRDAQGRPRVAHLLLKRT